MNRRPSGDDEARRDPQSSRPLRVLHVEDSEDDAELVRHALRRAGYDLTYRRIDSRPAMEIALAQQAWDVVLADYELPRFSGLAALLLLQNSGLDLPFLVVSGAIGEEVAVAAMKAGAQDYIMKGNLARLAPAIERELREAEVRRERRQAQEALRDEAHVSGALARVGQELISSLDTPGAPQPTLPGHYGSLGVCLEPHGALAARRAGVRSGVGLWAYARAMGVDPRAQAASPTTRTSVGAART